MIGALVLLQAALAGPVSDARGCLQRSDLVCAQKMRDRLAASDPNAADALRVQAWTAFHEGRYAEAVDALDALVEQGVNLEEEDEGRFPYRATADAAAGFKEHVGQGVRVRAALGVDQVLIDEAIDTLERARFTYDGLMGGGPTHDVVLDIFPTASRFIDASGLPPEAVRTTGVVALSKWTRLLVTSPRALARGYGWKDTIAHEYIHLVVAQQSGDRTPVWLQEGLAKYMEGQWRDQLGGGVSPHQESLLARAVHTGEFVPFEKFQRSMAYLDSGEEAALAFAQVATMVRFLLETAQDDVLPTLMRRLRDGEDSMLVVADLAGHEDFSDFRVAWQAWVAELPLVKDELAALPVVLDGDGGEFSIDPVLSGRTDLAKMVRLGDLLRDANRPTAALIEYGKAQEDDSPVSPMLVSRKAACLHELGQLEEALAMVDEGLEAYPEFTLMLVTRGRLLDALGRPNEAVVSWQAAHDLNPFDPEVQQALVEDHQALGHHDAAIRHATYAHMLATGGVVDTSEEGEE